MKERPILFSGPMVRAVLEGRKTQTRRVVKPQPPHGPFPCHYSRTGWAMASPPAGMNRHQGCTCSPLLPDYGQPGDRLWVRETWAAATANEVAFPGAPFWFHEIPRSLRTSRAADGIAYRQLDAFGRGKREFELNDASGLWDRVRWQPSIHMPRWASRLTLEVTGVRVERVRGITEQDADAEGFAAERSRIHDLVAAWPYGEAEQPDMSGQSIKWFRALWDSINAKRGYGWDANPWVWVVEFKRV